MQNIYEGKLQDGKKSLSELLGITGAQIKFLKNIRIPKDIEKFAEVKYGAFSCYSTELRDYPHPRSVQYLRETDKAAGLRVGLLAAEEFILLRKLI